MKLRTCPPAESFLPAGASAGFSVEAHLSACDFCGAEMQLLSRFPPPANALPFVASPLPEPLRRLAEEVMGEPSLNRARFPESLLDAERLTLTDA
ncbi:MAG TPA: hypothetical protein VD968_17405 [Pyrinomonadaceae bacterium]|nr:hypothetical protein [Pyrinomonadaceae bacterium]